MKNKLSCAHVIALFSFYIENKLNPSLKASVDSHLRTCSDCREFYSARNITNDFTQNLYEFNGDYNETLSAYIDNELDDNEAVRMRKITITNPVVRKKLEDMYTIKKEMHDHFNKIKNECKFDYSKDIIAILNGESIPDKFNKLVWTFTAMLSVILAGFIAMLYL